VYIDKTLQKLLSEKKKGNVLIIISQMNVTMVLL